MSTILTPYAYAVTLGVTSAQVIPSNPTRKGLIFFNPTNNVNIAVCPVVTVNGAALPAVIGGAGSITILSFGFLILPQAGWPDGISIGSAFNGIAAVPGTPLTIWEF